MGRAMAELEIEHDNLRAALTWSQAAGGAELGLRLALELRGFWSFHGQKSEARDWMMRALAHPEAQERTRLRAQVLRVSADTQAYLADYAAAQAAFAESLCDLPGAGGRAWMRRHADPVRLARPRAGRYHNGECPAAGRPGACAESG